MMKMSILPIAMLVLLALFACNRATELKDVKVKLPPELPATTELEKEIKRFHDEYGVLVNYQWDRYAFSKNAVADPAAPEDVLPYMEMVEEVFFKTIKAVQEPNKNFIDKETPVTFFLLGGGINYGGKQSFGEGTIGQAGNIQPNRLTLGGLNAFGDLLRNGSDEDFLNHVLENSVNSFPGEGGMVGFLYHEFTHYIDSKHDIPKDFQKPAFENYLRGTNSYRKLFRETANERGFMLPYGMQNEHEDLATYVQIMVWQPRDVIERDWLIGDAIKIKTKMVYDYYLRLGLDLYKVRDYVYSGEMVDRLLTLKRKYEK